MNVEEYKVLPHIEKYEEQNKAIASFKNGHNGTMFSRNTQFMM